MPNRVVPILTVLDAEPTHTGAEDQLAVGETAAAVDGNPMKTSAEDQLMSELARQNGQSRLIDTSVGMVILLTALTALGQFASNVYIAAMPAVAEDLDARMLLVQLTLTVFLLTFGLCQLVFGPLSDRFGRRPVLLAGTVIYVAGCAFCALAGSIEALLAGRFVQALGAGASLVAARALVRDAFSGVELTRLLATMSIAFAAVPGLSPLIGGLLQDAVGWRPIFWLAAGIGVAALVATWVRLPETNNTPLPWLDLRSAFEAYCKVARDGMFIRFTLGSALIMSAMSAFFAGAPVLFIARLDVSPTEFGFYPPLAVSGFVIGGMLVRKRFAGRSHGEISLLGLKVLFSGATLLVLLPLLGLVHKHAINAGIVIYVTGLGIFMPAVIAGALERWPSRAGSAAALIGTSQMVFGAATTTVVGLLQPKLPALSFPLVMLAATCCAGLLLRSLPRSSATAK